MYEQACTQIFRGIIAACGVRGTGNHGVGNRFVFASKFKYVYPGVLHYCQPELPSGLCCNDGQGGGQVCAGDQSVRHSLICVSERHRRRHLQSGCERAQQQLYYEPRAAHLPRVMHVL